MQTEAIKLNSRRGEELQYVTEHFKDLQGLRLAPLCAGLLVFCYAELAFTFSGWLGVGALFAILLLCVLWLVWIPRWYEGRYGVVASHPRPTSPVIPSLFQSSGPWKGMRTGYLSTMLLVIAMFYVPMLFHRFDRVNGQTGMWILVWFVLPKCFFEAPRNLWLNLRRVLYVTGAVAICASFLSYLMGQIGFWQYLAATAATMLLLSLYDHWLLGRLLRGDSREVIYE